MNEAQRLVQLFKAERDEYVRLEKLIRQLHWISLVVFSITNIVIATYWMTTTSTNTFTLMLYCTSYFAALFAAFYSYTQLKGDET